MPSLRAKIILDLNLSSGIIFTIKSINILLANMNRMFFIADIDNVSFKTLLVFDLVFSLFLLSILLQGFKYQ